MDIIRPSEYLSHIAHQDRIIAALSKKLAEMVVREADSAAIIDDRDVEVAALRGALHQAGINLPDHEDRAVINPSGQVISS